MSNISKKAAFIRPVDPDVFIRQEREKRTWMRHSVALLVVSPRVDHVAMTLPVKAAERDATNVRVPPQCALDSQGTVRQMAASMAREFLTPKIPYDDLHYLGSGRGNAHRGKTPVVYGKWIHWVGIRMQATRGVINKDAERFQLSYWCSANHLLSLDTYAMSDRKYVMTLQALNAFHTLLGADGKLTRGARRKLESEFLA